MANSKTNKTNNNEVKEVKEVKKPDLIKPLAVKIMSANNSYVRYAQEKAEQDGKDCYLTYISTQDTYKALKDIITLAKAKEDKDTLEAISALIKAYQVIDNIQPKLIQKIKAMIKLTK